MIETYEDRLLGHALDAFQREQRCYYYPLDAIDFAEAMALECERRFYQRVVAGASVEMALADEDARWRAYAAERNAQIDHGSRPEHWSTDRWVDPDLFKWRAPLLRATAARREGEWSYVESSAGGAR